MTEAVELLDNLYRHWRAQDIEGLCALFTDDCIYEDMAMRVVHEGKQALARFVSGVYGSMPDFEVVFRRRFATGRHGAGEWTVTATWRGPYEGVDVTGKRVRFEGISFYEFRDGKIARNVDCWDPTVLMEQLGVRAGRLNDLVPGAGA
jgi:steroid delta-isomerase-like uncharacterized protein